MGWSDLRRYEIIDSVFVTVWNYDYRPELHHMAGLDWDGEHLWASYNAGGVFKFDSSATAVDIFSYERELKVTESRSGPSNSPWNFAFSDTFLWIAELNTPYLLKCAKDSTFSVIEQYALPGPRPTGVVWDGEHIWTCDDFTGKVYKHLELSTESYDPEDEVLPEGAVATQVGGSISTDTQWTLEESPYLVTSEITVEPGAKLTIEPGVKVFFSESGGMEIQGVLQARGTPDSLIIFSHQQATKSWGSLKFSNSATAPELQSTLSYAKVQYCLEITLNQSSPEMSHNLFRYMTGIGGRPVPETHLVINDNLFYFAENGIRIGQGKYEENTHIVIDSNQFVYSGVVINSDFIQRQNFEIVNNTFDNSHVGILNSEGFKVKNNAFHNCVTGVGMNFARNIEIQGNTFDGPRLPPSISPTSLSTSQSPTTLLRIVSGKEY